MPNTYTQVYVHYVFATKGRMRFINESIQHELYTYISGITQRLNCFMQCIGGMDDHIHILVGLHPTVSLAEYAQKVKANSARYINDKRWSIGWFDWQQGYGAFSVAQSGLEKVRNYVNNQAEHHKRYSFLEEYELLLTKYKIDYDKRYIFNPVQEKT